ncbi:hypothetical protein QMO14_23150 [Variovorax sp. CAN2819]|uniref:hypothetical protein n=1 Tax=Variovorax sp. CAN15 TaxID=3046727 RepID=UPI0026497B56|nr:hypothetical protein [Variovorax sp. CAN15]MDN6886493.1 hypothetical protein [Variovorax sp. CAN15]
MTDLALSLVCLALAFVSWAGANRAIDADDDSTVIRYLVVMAGLGGIGLANTVGRF